MSNSNTTEAPRARKSWGRILLREVAIPLVLTILVIQFLISAFRIPSGSMEKSLLVGDFLLGLKFIYGSPLPYSEKRLPALAEPEPGDVVIFHYPMDPDVPDRNPDRFVFLAHTQILGDYYWDKTPPEGASRLVRYDSRDFIKRCVGVSGDTLVVRRKSLLRNGVPLALPLNGAYDDEVSAPWDVTQVKDSLGPFRIPAPGDVIPLNQIPTDEFLRIYSLAIQENPLSKVSCSLWVERDGVKEPDWTLRQVYLSQYDEFNLPNELATSVYRLPQGWVLGDYRIDSISQGISRAFQMMELPGRVRTVAHRSIMPRLGVSIDRSFQFWNSMDTAGDRPLRLKKAIAIDGKLDTNYVVKQKVLFMMGDNRDHSSDARFWGYLSRRNVKAKALVIYFSVVNEDDALSLNPLTWWRVPFRVRWSRIGRLVHD
jgi:signal peptidase I